VQPGTKSGRFFLALPLAGLIHIKPLVNSADAPNANVGIPLVWCRLCIVFGQFIRRLVRSLATAGTVGPRPRKGILVLGLQGSD
jgi:hypothetical protein